MKIIIVRHGETNWNKHGKLQGIRDIPVSKIGLHQAKLLANRLDSIKIDAIYTSKLKRSMKTAQEIQRFHKHAKIAKLKELNEMSWGIWEGMRMEDVRRKYHDLYEKRKEDRFSYKIPKGESPLILKRRLHKIVDRLEKQHKNQNILIVGHGGINRVLMGILLKWSNEKVLLVKLHNASITIINVKNEIARMILFNSKHHLENGNL